MKIIFCFLKISAVSKVQINLCWMFVLFVLMPEKKTKNNLRAVGHTVLRPCSVLNNPWLLAVIFLPCAWFL